MQQMPANAIEPRPRWRFSLRTAMVVMFVGCVLLGISSIVGPWRFAAYGNLAIPFAGAQAAIFGWATRNRIWTVVGISLFVLGLFLLPASWDKLRRSERQSATPLSATVKVVDARQKTPLANVRVTWHQGHPPKTHTLGTDSVGEVTFFIWDTNPRIRITAPGYAPVSFELAERTGQGQDLADPLPGPIRVELHRSGDPSAPENDPLREHFLP